MYNHANQFRCDFIRGKSQKEMDDMLPLYAKAVEASCPCEEEVVFKYEKARVKAYNSHLVNRVLSLGKTKGLGYDIQSVVAISGPTAEFSKYIEVKSTKRVTVPDVKDDSWFDSFTMTRNEYLAAQQHREHYSVFRVYFTRGGISFHVIENISQKTAAGKIEMTPIAYRVDFSGKSIDTVISTDSVQETINA